MYFEKLYLPKKVQKTFYYYFNIWNFEIQNKAKESYFNKMIDLFLHFFLLKNNNEKSNFESRTRQILKRIIVSSLSLSLPCTPL